MTLLFQMRIENQVEIPVRRMDSISREAMFNVGAQWNASYKGMHFAPGAAARYSYQPRKESYNRRKKKRTGHTTPLIYSGRTKSDVMGPIFPRATPRRVRAMLPTQAYIRIRSMRGHPPMGDELTRTTLDETEQLSKTYHDVMESMIKEYVEGRNK